MTIHQLSIFIENRSGTLLQVLQVLKESGIQIIASTIADTAEYGIYRLICSQPMKAFEQLKEAGVAVALSDVFAIELDDEPGRAADAIAYFTNAGIGLVYMYSFLFKGKGILIFRAEDPEKAKQAIVDNQLKYIAEDELTSLT